MPVPLRGILILLLSLISTGKYPILRLNNALTVNTRVIINNGFGPHECLEV